MPFSVDDSPPSGSDSPVENRELIERSLFYNLGVLVANASANKTVRTVGTAVSNHISERRLSSKREETETKIEKICLKKVSKCCPLTNFSCHSESTSNGLVFHAIFLPDSKSVWKSSNEEVVRLLCDKLDPLAKFPQDRLSKNLELLMTIVRKEPVWHTFHYAIACGFMHYLEAIILQDNSIVLDHVTPDGRPPLSIAAEMFQLESLKLLLGKGALLTQKDARGRTAVHWAAAFSVQVLEELLLSSPSSFHKCLFILDEDGYSPLGSAIRTANLKAVQFLMAPSLSAPLRPPNSGPLLNALIGLNPSPSLSQILELIASREIVKEVDGNNRTVEIVEQVDGNNRTVEIVEQVDGNNRTVEIVEQVDGNNRTVFHQDIHPQILSTLLNSFKHVKLNRKDKFGSTALHLAVERGDLDSTVLFLTYGAKVNEPDGKGETPLMKAAAADTGDSDLLVKALLVYDADIVIKSSSGDDVFKFSSKNKNRANIEKYLNIAAMKEELPQREINFLEDFARKLALECVSKELTDVENVFALSLDGGGIRGLVLIQILIEIEKKLGHPIMNYFDWVAGTSTGAILALALCQGKKPAYCRDLYFRLKNDVFTGSRPYSAVSLQRLLKEELGETTTMEAVAKGGKRVMVTTCEANISPPQLHLIRSYKLCPISGFGDPKRTSLSDPKTTPAWLAARCSSAAPTYFPSVKGTYMDGGLIANNPCCELLTDIQTYNLACQMDPSSARLPVRLGCVLSLGTGKSPLVKSNSIDVHVPQDFSRVFDVIDSVAHLGKVLIQQVTCADGAAVARSRSWCHSLSTPYFRLSPPLSEEIDLAETKNSVLIEMLWQTKVYMATEQHSISQLISLLESRVKLKSVPVPTSSSKITYATQGVPYCSSHYGHHWAGKPSYEDIQQAYGKDVDEPVLDAYALFIFNNINEKERDYEELKIFFGKLTSSPQKLFKIRQGNDRIQQLCQLTHFEKVLFKCGFILKDGFYVSSEEKFKLGYAVRFYEELQTLKEKNVHLFMRR